MDEIVEERPSCTFEMVAGQAAAKQALQVRDVPKRQVVFHELALTAIHLFLFKNTFLGSKIPSIPVLLLPKEKFIDLKG